VYLILIALQSEDCRLWAQRTESLSNVSDWAHSLQSSL